MTITPDQVRDAVAGLSNDQRKILTTLAQGRRLGIADRVQDRARQKLRRLGAIAYCGSPRRWQISALGLAIQSEADRHG